MSGNLGREKGGEGEGPEETGPHWAPRLDSYSAKASYLFIGAQGTFYSGRLNDVDHDDELDGSLDPPYPTSRGGTLTVVLLLKSQWTFL